MTDGPSDRGSPTGLRPILGPLNDSGSPGGVLGRQDLETLESLLAPLLEPRRYPAGRVLWSEGERSGRLTVIDEGRVKVTRARADGTSMLLYVFGPGTVFGFLPLLDGGPYPATAVAVEDVQARVASHHALRDAVNREPKLACPLVQLLGRRLREAFNRVEDLSHREALRCGPRSSRGCSRSCSPRC